MARSKSRRGAHDTLVIISDEKMHSSYLTLRVDIATIALWLGHESIETTHMYLQADLAMQEKALEKLDPLEGGWKRFQADDPLLTFLHSL